MKKSLILFSFLLLTPITQVKAQLNCCDIRSPKELYLGLRFIGIEKPLATILTQVSIYEAGWCYESTIAKANNNIFGIICYDTNCRYGHAYFDDKYECVLFMLDWIEFDPPRKGDNLYSWLKRRQYNTENPDYYNYLQKIYINFE